MSSDFDFFNDGITNSWDSNLSTDFEPFFDKDFPERVEHGVTYAGLDLLNESLDLDREVTTIGDLGFDDNLDLSLTSHTGVLHDNGSIDFGLSPLDDRSSVEDPFSNDSQLFFGEEFGINNHEFMGEIETAEPFFDFDVFSKPESSERKAPKPVAPPKASVDKTKAENLFTCPTCNKSFLSKHSLTKHQHIHLPPRFKCEQCNKNFFERSKLRRHQSVHNAQSSYQCGTCHRTFSLAHHLRSHMRIHSTIGDCFQTYQYVTPFLPMSHLSTSQVQELPTTFFLANVNNGSNNINNNTV